MTKVNADDVTLLQKMIHKMMKNQMKIHRKKKFENFAGKHSVNRCSLTVNFRKTKNDELKKNAKLI